jgi:hypothetical protein
MQLGGGAVLLMTEYAHMCRDGHAEIGFNDSETETCPVCDLLYGGTALFSEKELSALPGKLDGYLNQLTNLSKSPAKREDVRRRLDALLQRLVAALTTEANTRRTLRRQRPRGET